MALRAPLFSVVIATYNRRALVVRAVASVLAQTFPDYELIVVDDGSDDGTADVLRGYGDRVRVIRQSNQGPGAARNRGIAAAEGKYIAFLDSDDLWYPWTLESYASAITRESPAVLSGAAVCFGPDQEVPQAEHAPVHYDCVSNYLMVDQGTAVLGSGTIVVAADLLRQIGGFSGEISVAEDTDLLIRTSIREPFILFRSPAMIACCRGSMDSVQTLDKHFVGVRYLIEKETMGLYAGGGRLRRARRHLLAQMARNCSFRCLRAGRLQWAWWLYARTLRWQARDARIRYLAGFPLMAAWRVLGARGGMSRPEIPADQGRQAESRE